MAAGTYLQVGYVFRICRVRDKTNNNDNPTARTNSPKAVRKSILDINHNDAVMGPQK